MTCGNRYPEKYDVIDDALLGRSLGAWAALLALAVRT